MAMAADGGASGGQRRIVLITGASRGIGAQTARVLAGRGDHVVINYREKRKRAETLAAEITAAGGSASVAGADIADPVGARGLVESVVAEFGRLDVLVLNASGGLERDAVPGYAMLLNRDAQRRLTELALPHLPVGGRLVFVTSHQAHFSPTREVPPGYEPIAASKRAGEDAVRAMSGEFASRGIGFTVVSGDMIDGTIIVRLLERRDPDAVTARRDHGDLPTVEEFATAVADATALDAPLGHTVYVGGQDYVSDATAAPATARP
ncbi:SDR family oxidoreductase [Nocardia seriolae]|uniref:3-oxoacyl-[acyl-carrier-protein] reductase n=2 Tax=Nocardia seriolae TaxID=37332 RepID=A0ABC8AZJ3_9NOCA|nr:SDR family oxidoreductase [Nocardia seriolae]APA99501.1 3-oxoacyl-[acyl-carrier-protein] reductase [Nocardia seriolae]OJF81157.1 short chain dehydrogenase [Nocardia seriolae]WKY49665.1 SDR family oxidoreductase [Nocardia seriolae]WNJ62107.1 SDR family oxidoreductase [Nocardia seriolae]BAW06576.1 short-chain dehydrogenase [Nocardia seriolae]